MWTVETLVMNHPYGKHLIYIIIDTITNNRIGNWIMYANYTIYINPFYNPRC